MSLLIRSKSMKKKFITAYKNGCKYKYTQEIIQPLIAAQEEEVH